MKWRQGPVDTHDIMLYSPDMPSSSPSHRSRNLLFAFLFLLSIGFFSLVVYYIWLLNTTTPKQMSALEATFNSKFTRNPSAQEIPAPSKNEEDFLATIRSHNPRKGNPEAPLKILAFIDFECPYSQESYSIFQKVIAQFGPAIDVVFKHFPIDAIHPNATPASLAATCAQEQGKFWPYYDRLFQMKRLDSASLLSYAQELSLSLASFEQCRNAETYLKNIEEDLADGVRLGIRGTPTYFVNGKKIEGVIDEKQWRTIILDALQKI